MKKTALAFLLSLVATAAYGQSVKQSGHVTPGHLSTWTTNGVIQDGGIPGLVSSLTIGTTSVIGGTNGYCLFVSSTFVGNEICPGLSAITNLSGDVSAAGPGSAVATLATVNPNTGTFGSSTAIPTFSVNNKGLITSAAVLPIIAPAASLSGSILASNVVASSLTSVGTLATGVWNGSTIGVAYGGTGLTGGTSGGVLAFTASGTLASSAALTANLPVIGGGAGAVPSVGTVSGNTTTFATTKNALVSGDCVSIDGSGNLVDAGGPCTTGGGGGTVSSASAGQLTYYASSGTVVVGNGNANISSGTLTLGTANTTLGAFVLEGNTSGAVTVRPTAAAGTYNFVLPTTAGTTGQPLLSGGGSTTAQTYGTLSAAFGGTGLTSGTSGGVLAFTGSTTITSSGALTANLPVIGGGAGSAPSVGTRSGNTTKFVTTTGGLVNGDCVSIDSNGNFVDNGSACSSTSGTVTGPVSSTNTAIPTWAGTGGTALNNSVDTISSAGTLTITTTANSYNQGLNITQSSPTSGSQAGPFSYNRFACTDESNITGAAGTVQASCIRVDMTVGGANLGGQPKIAGYFNMIESIAGVTNATDKIGIVGGALIQIAEASTGAGAYGGNFFAGVQSSGSIARLVGAECDIQIASGSSATNRYCFSAVNVGVVQGSTLDSVIFVANIGGTAGAFKSLVEFSNAFGFAPMATTANLFSSDATFTINDVFHFANAQINGDILNFPNVVLVGNGALTLGNASNSAGGSITFNGATSGSFILEASGTGLPTLTNVQGPNAGTDPLCYNTGSFLLTWATTCAASDERIKTNFGPAPGLAAVLCLNGITFDLLDADQAKRKGRQVGLIAQDVQKCVPEVVSDEGTTKITLADGTSKQVDHTLAVDYPRLTAVLINAVHELNAELQHRGK